MIGWLHRIFGATSTAPEPEPEPYRPGASTVAYDEALKWTGDAYHEGKHAGYAQAVRDLVQVVQTAKDRDLNIAALAAPNNGGNRE